ncbi:hypothetical protein OV090_11015 [Nannocystis sp. RBIL2]|uniref:hypothetical protein n=1 Tax=Nannocystis sp. RBIL2 TaxID=2996788 RepID=UPI00227161D2|nr:hypothetical protein [Nannocystis sp. RBIL2]MCY1065295.1 hypothetical protein [Nannocystis sp. RBIL2]
MTAALAGAGQLQGLNTRSVIVAKAAGFSLLLGGDPKDSQEHRQIISVSMYGNGFNGHRTFADLPSPFVWGDRAAVLASAPAPLRSFAMPHTANVLRDEWEVSGLSFSAGYDKDAVVGQYSVGTAR